MIISQKFVPSLTLFLIASSLISCSPDAKLVDVDGPALVSSSTKPGSGSGGTPATSAHHRLFVSSLIDNSVGVFDYETAQPLAVISDPSLNQPAGLAVSGSYLYVANNGNDSLSIFDVNKYTFVSTVVGNGLKKPLGMVATGGAAPKLFVVNQNGIPTSVFLGSSGAPSGMVNPSGSALGVTAYGSSSTGSNLYFSGADPTINLVDYKSLSQSGSIPEHTTDIHYGIAYGYGNIYVSNFLSNSVDVYDATSKSYTKTLTGNYLSGPCGVAVGGGRVYVANFFSGTAGDFVSQFDAISGAPLTSGGSQIEYGPRMFYVTYY